MTEAAVTSDHRIKACTIGKEIASNFDEWCVLRLFLSVKFDRDYVDMEIMSDKEYAVCTVRASAMYCCARR